MDNPKNIELLHEEVLKDETKALWVFAYGSLCWKPGFRFSKAVKGHIQGYHRRFWQGNTTHRGTEDKPGRVATLIENSEVHDIRALRLAHRFHMLAFIGGGAGCLKGKVPGIAFALTGEAAIPYLSRRECQLGGYTSELIDFYPMNGESFKVLVYIATPKNRHWLGEATEATIVDQIITCSGNSGHNVEYIMRLADFNRKHFPEHRDDHLLVLEKEILRKVNELDICLIQLMGNDEECVTFIKCRRDDEDFEANENPDPHQEERTDTFEFTTRVPGKVLRCLNI